MNRSNTRLGACCRTPARASGDSSAPAYRAISVTPNSPTRRGIDIYSKDGAPVVAVNDGIITKVGQSKQLGRFIVLRDAYGNKYTYAGLGKIAKAIPVPKQHSLTAKDFDLITPGQGDKKPKVSASETTRQQTIHNEAETGPGAGNGKGEGKGGGDEKQRRGGSGERE